MHVIAVFSIRLHVSTASANCVSRKTNLDLDKGYSGTYFARSLRARHIYQGCAYK